MTWRAGNIVKALLLAAGLGTRLRPLTDHCPKCLMPINGKPLLSYWLEKLEESSQIDEIGINLHYLHHQVLEFLTSLSHETPLKTIYEPRLLGTAGTIKANEKWLKNNAFMLIHADNFSSIDIDDFIHAHLNRPKNCHITMLTFQTDKPENCGIIHADTQGIVHNFYEKSHEYKGDIANGAVYICEPEILQFICQIPHDDISFSDDVIPHFLRQIFAHHIKTYHVDIGTHDNYRLANEIATTS